MELPRRRLLGAAAMLAPAAARAASPPAIAGAGAPGVADRMAWDAFKAAFLAPEGRVMDTGNGNQAHSEGQGWGMMLAVHFRDREAFDRLWGWTRRHLRRDSDSLHSWRWQPDRVPPVADPNNATDGDLFIAAALLRAARLWSEPALEAAGADIARDVLRLLVRRAGGYLVLLPGARGFERRDHVVINPSYYAYPAIAVLAESLPDPAWLRLAGDGLRLLRAAQFGRWGLSPDWVAVARQDGRVAPAEGWPARFSYDAVRVPLWLSWAGMGDEPAVAASLGFWSDLSFRQVPAWADLASDAVAPYPAGQGIHDIGRLAAAQRGTRFDRPGRDPSGRDYYDTALSMLARMAAAENGNSL